MWFGISFWKNIEGDVITRMPVQWESAQSEEKGQILIFVKDWVFLYLVFGTSIRKGQILI